MKTLTTLALICILFTPARAQYALQIGKKRVPIKTGDSISRETLFSGFVRLLYLPDTIYPNCGIKEVAVITVANKGNASAYSFSGNTLFPLPSLRKGARDSLVNAVTIAQVRDRKDHINPVMIRLILAE